MPNAVSRTLCANSGPNSWRQWTRYLARLRAATLWTPSAHYLRRPVNASREIDAQIEPLEALETLRAADTLKRRAELPRPEGIPPNLGAPMGLREFPLRHGGRSTSRTCAGRPGCRPGGQYGEPDAQAQRAPCASARRGQPNHYRYARAFCRRPLSARWFRSLTRTARLITSLGGAKPLGSIPGTTFTRPVNHATCHGWQANGRETRIALAENDH